MIRTTMPLQGVLSTNRVERRRIASEEIIRLCLKILTIARAVSLCRPAARKPCGLPYRVAPAIKRKRDTRRRRRVSGSFVPSFATWRSDYNARTYASLFSGPNPMLLSIGCAQQIGRVKTIHALYPCHPDRPRTTLSLPKGSEWEWKDPENDSHHHAASGSSLRNIFHSDPAIQITLWIASTMNQRRWPARSKLAA